MSPRVWLGLAIIAAVVFGALRLAPGTSPERPQTRARQPLRTQATRPLSAGSDSVGRLRQRGAQQAEDLANPGTDVPGGGALALPSWEAVDLDEVRRALPENIYWAISAPTDDPEEKDRRRAERDRWNVEYGKVLSGTGTEEEIRAYFDHRANLFGDYVELTTYLIDHYESVLPQRDVGMLMLARRLSLARLEELPRKIEEAMTRRDAQEKARNAWLADQESFADSATMP